jgi:hypothetical protein
MKNRWFAHTAVCWLIAAGTASVLETASAQIEGVAGGTDYLQTAAGTEAMLPYGLGTLALHGVPIKSATGKNGNTDTKIGHLPGSFGTGGGTATTSGPTAVVPIFVQELNLEGTVQASSPASGTCTVHVNLAPTPPSTGQLMLTVTSATGGTYSSQLMLNVQITFTPDAAGVTCYPPIPNARCAMTQGIGPTGQQTGVWSTVPLAGEFLVQGPYGDLAANDHTGLPPGIVDFYISKLQTDSAATAERATCEAFTALHKPCPNGTKP